MTKLERLDEVLRRDPQRAKVEILKHLDGDLLIVPGRPSPASTGPRSAAAQNTTGRWRSGSSSPSETRVSGLSGWPIISSSLQRA